MNRVSLRDLMELVGNLRYRGRSDVLPSANKCRFDPYFCLPSAEDFQLLSAIRQQMKRIDHKLAGFSAG